MRASRLLQLLLLLQARGGMSAPQLAEELEVSVRTVYRDLEALSAAGVPVYTETGRNGGARLVDGWRTRLTGLTGEEADTLPLLGMPGAAAAELGLGSVLAATQLKLLAALPPELRSRASRVAERFLLDAPGWFHRDEGSPHLANVAQAVWDDRRVRMRYERSDRVVDRTVDALGLVLKAGVWYLVAAHRGQQRTYRISRIRAVECLDRFDRPAGFDLEKRWAESSHAFEQAMRTVEVRLRIEQDAQPLLRHALDPGTYETVVADGDEVSLLAESVEVIVPHLLWLGGRVEVLAPDELRRRVADEVRTAVARYETGVPAIASTSRAARAR